MDLQLLIKQQRSSHGTGWVETSLNNGFGAAIRQLPIPKLPHRRKIYKPICLSICSLQEKKSKTNNNTKPKTSALSYSLSFTILKQKSDKCNIEKIPPETSEGNANTVCFMMYSQHVISYV